ncbi:MAG: Gfo/Idh/MocA family oxidoreductase [Chloroflexota bacterium]|nr:Gfo/Idh/MocA family oxidoreductase [Chloroflexota bacterium]MDQ5867010.1 Gfo/Idh/MocA family oxidoreductase [Chloroflexota bacterium]
MTRKKQEVRNVRLGIIGAGLAIKWLHWPPLKRMPDRFSLVAVADIDENAARETAEMVGGCRWTTNYQDLLSADDVEAVLISLPIHLNAQVLVESAVAGKHVLCEKPVGSNLQQAQEVVSAVRDLPTVVAIAEQFHHRRDIKQIEAWIEEGRIGKPFLVDAANRYWTDTNKGFGATPWRQDSQYRGGAITDAGVHQAALLRHLGGEIEQVQAFTRLVHPELSGVDTMVLNLRYRNGVLGRFMFSAAAAEARGPYMYATVYGTEGMIVLEDSKLRLCSRGAPEETQEYDGSEAYYDQLVNFHQAITEGEPVVSTPEEAMRDLEVLMRAYDSAESRSVVLL